MPPVNLAQSCPDHREMSALTALTPLQARNKLGAATRYGDADQIEDARRDLAAAKLSTYVARVVAEAPPLTDAQRDLIAALLRPSGGERR